MILIRIKTFSLDWLEASQNFMESLHKRQKLMTIQIILHEVFDRILTLSAVSLSLRAAMSLWMLASLVDDNLARSWNISWQNQTKHHNVH